MKTSKTSEPPLHASEELLDVDNVAVHFGTETVLDQVSFCVHAGEFIGLIGPNGAGKTTLLRIMLGLLAPTSGTIRRNQASHIGYIPQRGNHYDGIVPMSALEVVMLGARGSYARAQQALQETGIENIARKSFAQLSGGQQQRVAIAKALASQADILILDEPATGIDERSQAEFYALLQKLQKKNITMVMVSHEIEAVLALVTRVVCLNRSILYDGPPEHFESDKYLPARQQARHVQLHHQHGEVHA